MSTEMTPHHGSKVYGADLAKVKNKEGEVTGYSLKIEWLVED